MATAKDWTIMVYMAGDNNLDSAGVVDLKEMKKVGSTKEINVIVQFDREGKNMATNRYYIQKGGTVAKDKVASLGETNMGDPKVLEDFVNWGVKNYPAKHNLLVLWNHGAGWDDANLYEGDVFSGAAPPVSRKNQVLASGRGVTRSLKPLPFTMARAALSRTKRALFRTSVEKAIKSRAIAFDDQAKDFLDNIELKRVMTRIKKVLKRPIDILGMDACLMSMTEVAYQMRAVANYSVGSEETEPGDGWPYDRILKILAAKPSMTPEDVSKLIVTQYIASYTPNDNVTQSAVRLANLKSLTSAVSSLGKSLSYALAYPTLRDAIMTGRARVQEYSRPYDDYCDLLNLCDILESSLTDSKIRTACDAVKESAKDAIVVSGYKGSAVNKSHGLSIYFPKRKLSPLYKTLDFTKASAWDEFLKAYIASL
ncbi:MAG: clostripain-related cysteine peptidase [Syntrophaceae bacterium]